MTHSASSSSSSAPRSTPYSLYILVVALITAAAPTVLAGSNSPSPSPSTSASTRHTRPQASTKDISYKDRTIRAPSMFNLKHCTKPRYTEFIFSLQFNNRAVYLKGEKKKVYSKDGRLGIHGLWPAYSGPSDRLLGYCDELRERPIKNFSEDVNSLFSEEQFKKLDLAWPHLYKDESGGASSATKSRVSSGSYYSTGYSDKARKHMDFFRENEWMKHGTCVEAIDYRCYDDPKRTPAHDAAEYMRMNMDLFDKMEVPVVFQHYLRKARDEKVPKGGNKKAVRFAALKTGLGKIGLKVGGMDKIRKTNMVFVCDEENPNIIRELRIALKMVGTIEVPVENWSEHFHNSYNAHTLDGGHPCSEEAWFDKIDENAPKPSSKSSSKAPSSSGEQKPPRYT